MASPFLFSLLSLLIFTCSTATATATATITIPLSPFTNHHPSTDPYQLLTHLATSTLSRAHHLKNPKTKIKTKTKTDSLKTPLFPHSYGGYAISLSFGTPPQTIPFIMDTGSSLVWFPCTSRYLCSTCNFPNIDPSHIPTFIPKKSSSSKLLGCKNLKCSWLFGPDVKSRCQDCDSTTPNCTRACPPYILQYGLGSTAGLLLTETLDFPHQKASDFVVGCSIFSSRQPSGVAGFGRGRESLPSQMGLKKFSYCLVSHKFDDEAVSSDMVLDAGSGSSDAKTRGVSYTPFYRNPVASNAAFQEYYYVVLRKIIVGGKHVKIPYSYLVPGSDGNGGTIVDSGSTFTYMERPVFELVAQEFEKQMGNYSRAADVEKLSGLSRCFKISREKSVFAPELIIQFKGGAKMALPLADYFSFFTVDVVCLTILSDGGVGEGVSSGPAIILGNYQQQNYYVEYDLENDRFGFRRQTCT